MLFVYKISLQTGNLIYVICAATWEVFLSSTSWRLVFCLFFSIVLINFLR